jgi:HEAT repeat protein
LNRPFVNEALFNQYKKERNPKVKAAILTTLGELKAIEFISELKGTSSGSDNQLAIRALVSLSTMNRQSMTLDERRESSLRLCQLVSSSMVEERRLVCIGLRNLGIGDDDQVFQTLLKLLQDENATVRLEAGKTLTLLQT